MVSLREYPLSPFCVGFSVIKSTWTNSVCVGSDNSYSKYSCIISDADAGVDGAKLTNELPTMMPFLPPSLPNLLYPASKALPAAAATGLQHAPRSLQGTTASGLVDGYLGGRAILYSQPGCTGTIIDLTEWSLDDCIREPSQSYSYRVSCDAVTWTQVRYSSADCSGPISQAVTHPIGCGPYDGTTRTIPGDNTQLVMRTCPNPRPAAGQTAPSGQPRTTLSDYYQITIYSGSSCSGPALGLSQQATFCDNDAVNSRSNWYTCDASRLYFNVHNGLGCTGSSLQAVPYQATGCFPVDTRTPAMSMRIGCNGVGWQAPTPSASPRVQRLTARGFIDGYLGGRRIMYSQAGCTGPVLFVEEYAEDACWGNNGGRSWRTSCDNTQITQLEYASEDCTGPVVETDRYPLGCAAENGAWTFHSCPNPRPTGTGVAPSNEPSASFVTNYHQLTYYSGSTCSGSVLQTSHLTNGLERCMNATDGSVSYLYTCDSTHMIAITFFGVGCTGTVHSTQRYAPVGCSAVRGGQSVYASCYVTSSTASPTPAARVTVPQGTVSTAVVVAAAVGSVVASVAAVSAVATASSATGHVTQSNTAPWRQLIRSLLKALRIRVNEEPDTDEAAMDDDVQMASTAGTGGTSGGSAGVTSIGIASATTPAGSAVVSPAGPALSSSLVTDPSSATVETQSEAATSSVSVEETAPPAEKAAGEEEDAEEEEEEDDSPEKEAKHHHRQRVFSPLAPGSIRKERSLADIPLPIWILYYIALFLDQTVRYAESFSPVPIEDIPFLSVVQSFFVWRVVTKYIQLRLRAAGVRVGGRQLLLDVTLAQYARIHLGQAVLQILTLGCSSLIAELVGWGSGTTYDFGQNYVDAWLDAHLCWFKPGTTPTPGAAASTGSGKGPLASAPALDLKQEKFVLFRAGSSLKSQWKAKLARWSTCRVRGDKGLKATLADYEEVLESMRFGGKMPIIRPRTRKGLNDSLQKMTVLLGLAPFEIAIEKRLKLVWPPAPATADKTAEASKQGSDGTQV